MTPLPGLGSIRWLDAMAIVLSICVLCGVGWWALRTDAGIHAGVSEAVVHVAREPVVGAQGVSRLASGLDLCAFDAPVWVIPPAPPRVAPVVIAERPVAVPPPVPVPLPPLKLQLIAIIVQTDRIAAAKPATYQAIVYDPESDALLTLDPGQMMASGRGVGRIDAKGVEFHDGGVVRMLALREEEVPAFLGQRPNGDRSRRMGASK